MLETLVSSKIRRALLEYILTHATTRFYLRGLAKELGVAVSPLRRELKRLEQLGVLKAYDEANIRFYVVEQASPQFAELKSVSTSMAPAPVPQPEPLVSYAKAPLSVGGQIPSTMSPAGGLTPLGGLTPPVVLSHAKVERLRRASPPRGQWGWQALTRPLSWPVLLGTVSAGLLMVMGLAGIAYLAVTNQRLLALMHQAIGIARPQVAVIESVEARPSSGEMHSSRWRLSPGTMGGFSAGASEESY